MAREITLATLRASLVKIIGEAEQSVRDCMYWNNNRPDEEPMDCEDFRIAARLGRQALAEFDAGNLDRHSELVSQMCEHMTKAVADGRDALKEEGIE